MAPPNLNLNDDGEFECSICTYVIGQPRGDSSVESGIFLPCSHTFGHLCLAEALRSDRRCPNCRGDIHPDILATFSTTPIASATGRSGTGDVPTERPGLNFRQLDEIEAERDAQAMAEFSRTRISTPRNRQSRPGPELVDEYEERRAARAARASSTRNRRENNARTINSAARRRAATEATLNNNSEYVEGDQTYGGPERYALSDYDDEEVERDDQLRAEFARRRNDNPDPSRRVQFDVDESYSLDDYGRDFDAGYPFRPARLPSGPPYVAYTPAVGEYGDPLWRLHRNAQRCPAREGAPYPPAHGPAGSAYNPYAASPAPRIITRHPRDGGVESFLSYAPDTPTPAPRIIARRPRDDILDEFRSRVDSHVPATPSPAPRIITRRSARDYVEEHRTRPNAQIIDRRPRGDSLDNNGRNPRHRRRVAFDHGHTTRPLFSDREPDTRTGAGRAPPPPSSPPLSPRSRPQDPASRARAHWSNQRY